MSTDKMYSKTVSRMMWFPAFLLVVLMTGCDRDHGTAGPADSPTVTSLAPAHAAFGVAINRKITATFSEPMDAGTIIAPGTFTVTGPFASPVTGTVTYDEPSRTAIFTPTGNLLYNTTYIVTISTAAKCLDGGALAGPLVWSFSTAAALDTIMPFVSFTVPADGDLSVAVNRKLVATFSEAMDAETINAANVSVTGPDGAVSGSMTYAAGSNAATFTPSATLLNNSSYTVTISTGIKDLAGNFMATAYIWSFTTAAAPDTFAPRVSSTNPVDGAVTVPITRTIRATFSEAMDPATITTANVALMNGATPVPGTVAYDVPGNIMTFTPASALSLDTAYTVLISTGARDLAGNSLTGGVVPNPWSFTTSAAPLVPPTVTSVAPVNGTANVAINRKVTATFSDAMDAGTLTAPGAFTLTGPFVTPVTGTVTYDGPSRTATFTPSGNLSNNATYIATISTGVENLAGSPLVMPFVWSFSTALTPDTTAPQASFTSPSNNEAGVAVNRKIVATFNEGMDSTTIIAANVTVTGPGGIVSGAVTYAAGSNAATFTPTSNLLNNTVYTVTITTGVKDLAGNAIAVNKTWSFITAAALDSAAPQVSSTNPVDSAATVPINKTITATFSEAMDPATITTANVVLTNGATSVPGTVAYDVPGSSVTFTPTSPLAFSTTYAVRIGTGARDLAGNSLAGGAVPNPWTFTTAAVPLIPPTVTSVTPANATTGVALNRKVTATFSEPMDSATIIAPGTFTLTGPFTTPVTGTVAYDSASMTATFTPTGNLLNNTTYSAALSTGAMNPAGAGLTSPFVWSFSTASTPDTTAPFASFTAPADGDLSVAANRKIVATFSEGMDAGTIIAANVSVTGPGGSVSGAVTYAAGSNAATFTPSGNLAPGATYTVTITTGVKDLAGNSMATNKIWSFTTTAPDATAPRVSSTNPAHLAVNVSVDKKISATFTESMDPATISTANVTLMNGVTPVPGTVAYDAAGNIMTFTPVSPLALDTTYTVQISTGATDLAGNSLIGGAVPNPWSFTTAATPVVPPTVTSATPANGIANVAVNQKILATFSQPMDSATLIAAGAFTLTGPFVTPVTGTVAYDAPSMTATFTPAGNLANNTTYIATISTGASNLAGAGLTVPFVWSFSTALVPDTTSPFVSFTSPSNGEASVAINRKLVATFSEGMDPGTIIAANVTVVGPSGSVSGAVTYAAGSNAATFTPTSNLATSAVYTVTITTGVKDLAGNAMATNKLWSFTTAALPDTTAPQVSSTNPAAGAVSVPITKIISATFSEAMDPATITTANITLTNGVTPVAGTVAYNVAGSSVTFTPSSTLAFSTTYTVLIGTGAKDLAGNSLSGGVTNPWTFTTAAAPLVPPTVTSVTPANATTGVALNRKVTATFSEPMDPAAITAPGTFTLTGPFTTPVTGTVAYDGPSMTATFTPTGNLLNNTTYTATISTNAENPAGAGLASPFVWRFSTAATPDTTAPFVSFTSPSNGEAGVAVNRKIVATFNEGMDASTISAANMSVTGPSGAVSGAVTYAAGSNAATFTPTANLLNNSSYTVTITTGVLDLAGNALAASYIWSFTTAAAPDTTGPQVSSTNPTHLSLAVSVDKKITATFNEAMDPLTIITANVTLLNGVTPVPGTVAYDAAGNIMTFTPVSPLALDTTYTVQISAGAADLAGNALAGGAVPNPWSFTTAAAPLVPPTVTSVAPANGTANVAINQKITATFSGPMDPLTITAAGTFTLTGPFVTPVAGTVTFDAPSRTATFTPLGNLVNNTTYIATISTVAANLAGSPLAGPFVWSFSTALTPDTTAPVVSYTAPADGDLGVAVNRKIVATFSEGMDPSTIIAANVSVTGPDGVVSGAVTYAAGSNAATFTPSGNLLNNRSYTVTITTGVRDLAGNFMATAYVWSFTTAALPDTTAPRVSSANPVDGAVTVPIAKKITATFSEAMDPLTIITANVTLLNGITPVPGTVAYDVPGNIMTFTPTSSLTFSTTYTVLIGTGAADLAGNALVSGVVPNPWTFTTAAAPLIPPTVTSVTPAHATTGVALNRKLTAAFSEAMDPLTITAPGTFTLTGPFTTPVTGTVAYDGPSMTATFTPTGNLLNNTTYTATISINAENPAGAGLATPFVWSFSTALTPDTTAPFVSFTSPSNGEASVAINRKIIATFSEAMDPATIIAANVSVTGPDGSVSGSVTYAAGSNAATFTPSVNLLNNSAYAVTITSGVKDLAGNFMAANFVWSFTTAAAPDTTSPQVSSTNPAHLAADVPLDKKITATFNEAMDPATIITANVTLLTGVTPVPGTVAYDASGNIATFTPLSPLAFSTTYTALISTGAADLAGNALVSGVAPNPWSFTTAAAPVVPIAINLRSAASFAIAARSGLASTGVNVVNGDVALWTPSPTCTDATGLPANCAVNPKPASATGLTVNGSIYFAGDLYDNGGTANSVANDVNIAWTEGMNKADTQGAVAADEMGGKTFFSGVYHNAAALGLAAGAVATLDAQGDANAVFIFKVGSSFTDSGTLASPSEIKLINGAQARNVWFVATAAVTLGSGTKWNGNILAGGAVTINSGSTVNGRVFAGAAGAGAITVTGAAAPSVTTVTVPQ